MCRSDRTSGVPADSVQSGSVEEAVSLISTGLTLTSIGLMRPGTTVWVENKADMAGQRTPALLLEHDQALIEALIEAFGKPAGRGVSHLATDTGSLLSSLLALMDGGSAAMPSSLASTALGGLSAVVSGLLLRQLAGDLAADEEEPREEDRGS